MAGAGDPYLSLVVTARNDDHGGNLLQRMQLFVSGWIAQARRFQIPSELIIVEWNPPPDRPRLARALQWPHDFGPCSVRFIEVPPELHRTFQHAGALPLYQMLAKNAGLRRARGRFALATNIDILFSDELAGFLAEQRLEKDRMYRIDRHDAMSDVPGQAPLVQQLEYCRTHLIRVNVREGTYNVSPDGRPILRAGDIAAQDSGLLFGRGWLPVERYTAQEPFRWAGQHAELLLETPPENVSALVVELEPGPGTGNAALDLEVVREDFQVLAHVNVSRRSRLRLPLASPLPARLWFRVRNRGLPTEQDPRILNFRAFRFAWEQRPGARAGSDSAALTPVGGRNFIVSSWFALQHLIDRLAKGGRLVKLTVPVSPRLQRWLKMYIEYRGFVGLTRHSFSIVKRRMSFHAACPPGEDIFPSGSGLSPGAGWQPLEDYRGESFRRARDRAEVIVSSSASISSELGLQVEPSADATPLDVMLLDSSERVIAKQRVARLAFLRIPLQREAGRTQIIRIGLAGGEAAELKVFWCGWAGSAPSPVAVLSQPWGAGWRWDPETDSMLASSPAELVVRAPDGDARPLFIDLQPSPAVEFEIRDGNGKTLAASQVHCRTVHRLDLNLEPGRTHVLELAATGPLRAYGCDWTETPGANSAAFVHTNACGDFTLMAREHWFDLRGYPEFDLFSMNLDSILCVAAHYGGVPEQMLTEPMRIYHIEHATGSGWTPEGQAQLFERIRARGLSFVDNEEVLGWAAQMSRLKSPMVFNHEDWGLADFDLRETVLPE
ncbi:MAG TPA: hypothetical protein VEV17_25745 [Bryobacteraceae bacterium]|nr:hypothetical protein [Bryobacteraceae bacterium]